MFRSVKLLSLGLEVAISIIVGLITTYWVSGAEAFVIGLGAFFCIEMVRMRFTTEQAANDASRVVSLLELIRPMTPVSELALLFGLGKISQLKADSITVDREKAWVFWRECMLRAKTRWAVLSYSLPDEGWALAWNKAVLALRAERVACGCRVERIFIVETEEEVEQLRKVMVDQTAVGVTVGYAYRRDLTSPRVMELLKQARTLDFAVVDGSWVFLSNLDRKRKVLSVGADQNFETVKSASVLFEEVSFLAHKIEAAAPETSHREN